MHLRQISISSCLKSTFGESRCCMYVPHMNIFTFLNTLTGVNRISHGEDSENDPLMFLGDVHGQYRVTDNKCLENTQVQTNTHKKKQVKAVHIIFLHGLCKHPKTSNTLIRIPSMKSHSIIVPSAEQE